MKIFLRIIIFTLFMASKTIAAQDILGYLNKGKVNFREGPNENHAILWTYTCPGWPVKILRTYEYWCYVEDFMGAKGWVKRTLLGVKPTYLVLKPKHLYKEASVQSPLVATLEKSVIVQSCDQEAKGSWIKVRVYTRDRKEIKGWINHDNLWPKISHKIP